MHVKWQEVFFCCSIFPVVSSKLSEAKWRDESRMHVGKLVEKRAAVILHPPGWPTSCQFAHLAFPLKTKCHSISAMPSSKFSRDLPRRLSCLYCHPAYPPLMKTYKDECGGTCVFQSLISIRCECNDKMHSTCGPERRLNKNLQHVRPKQKRQA